MDSYSERAVAAPHIPALSFTMAIVGHRSFKFGDARWLLRTIGGQLAHVAQALPDRAKANALDRDRPITRRFVSALAEGADQIAMAAAHASKGWQCEAILPFARDAYTHTFSGNSRPFYRLLAKTDRVLELADWDWRLPADGPANPDNDDGKNAVANEIIAYWQARRYASVGQTLVKQADLLIAVWDGAPPRGEGGTAHIVADAHRAGVPVIWLQPATRTIRSILPTTAEHARFRIGQPLNATVEGADAAIDQAIGNTLLGEGDENRGLTTQYLADNTPRLWRGSDGAVFEGTGSAIYSLVLWLALGGYEMRRWPFRFGYPLRQHRRWYTPFMLPFDGLIQAISSSADAKLNRDEKPRGDDQSDAASNRHNRAAFPDEAIAACTDVDMPLAPFMRRADAIATRLGHHYRSAYIAIFALAAIAVVFAGAWLAWPAAKPVFVLIELGCIMVAVGLWRRMSNRDSGWINGVDTHQRWLDARLVAESLRSTQFLCWIGFSGRRTIREPAHGPGKHAAKPHAPARQTQCWAPPFANAVAALPALPNMTITPARIAIMSAALENIIAGQKSYHLRNGVQLERLHRWLDHIGESAIISSACVSVFYLVVCLGVYMARSPGHGDTPHMKDLSDFSEHLAAFFGSIGPAIAAAMASIRYHGDYERFAKRSAQTAVDLSRLEARAVYLASHAAKRSDLPSPETPPLYEDLLELMLQTQAALDEDLVEWRNAYALRPLPLP